MHYSEYLAREFDVISLAVSGQNFNELKFSTFLQLKNHKYVEKTNKQIMHFGDYENICRCDPEKEKIAKSDLFKYSRVLNNKLRDDFELEEGQRPLLVSGILIALENNAFHKSYKEEKTAKNLANSLSDTIKKVLEDHNVEQKKRDDITNVYNFIETNNNIAKDFGRNKNTKLRELVTEINDNVRAFAKEYDILGQFYGEFLRYANIDQGLGIVLTPHHITEIFVDLAQINKNSVVLDNCCGTGGFLISSMREMVNDATMDSEKIEHIYKKQLIGIENNAKMFCLACSNMLLRGDGKSNIYHYDCFKMDKSNITELKPTVGFLNPPYSKKKEGSEELNYVLNCLDYLESNGLCVSILPMSCAVSSNIIKEKLLKKHTLVAVMSLPIDLFYPIGVTPCIMVFKAHLPHDSNTETWFGYWRDDGFVKVKHEGRVDKNNRFKIIKKTWLEDFRNKRSIAGRCITRKISFNDEWCAEAYMKTDYNKLNEDDFKKTVNEFIIFKIGNDMK